MDRVKSSEALLSVLKRSALLTSDQFKQVCEANRTVTDVKILARRLIQQQNLTQWQVQQLVAGKSRFHLGKYRLIDSLSRDSRGRDSRGRVFLAEHPQMQRRVVLRVLAAHEHPTSTSVQQFVSEARAIAAMDHRNIIHVYDFESESDGHFLVMEYVEGWNLQSLVDDQGAMDVEVVADNLRQVAEGLAYVHLNGMIHGDIKPANLRVDVQGTVKIMNLGVVQLAKLDAKGEKGENQSSPDSDGELQSESVWFQPPEQSDSSRTNDPRADIFALGCTCYYLLTGRKPTPPGGEQPQQVQDGRPDVPDAIAEICRRMMATDPAERYRSAEQVRDALDEWLRGIDRQAVSAVEPPIDSPTFKPDKGVKKPPQKKPPQKKPPLVHSRPEVKTESSGGTLPKQVESLSWAPSPSVGSPPVAEKPVRSKQMILYVAALVAGCVALLGLSIVVVWMLFWPERPEPQTATGQQVDAAVIAGNNALFNAVPVVDPPAGDPPADDQAEAMPAPGSEARAQEPGPVEEPVVEPAKTGEPEPMEPEPVEPEPVEPEPVEPPPEAAPDPPAEPPPADPRFTDFPGSVNLPHLSQLEGSAGFLDPFLLGTVKVDPGELLFVSLMGADKEENGAQYLLRRSDNGLAERDWDIYTDAARSESDPLAHLSLKDNGNLEFQWTEAGLAEAKSSYLRNCPLNLEIAGESHTVALRQPIMVGVEPLDLEKARMRTRVKIDSAPDARALYFEITSLDGEFAEYTFEPSERIEASKGMTAVLVGKEFDKVFALKCEVQVTSHFSVIMVPYFRVATERGPMKYTKQMVQKASAKAANLKVAAEAASLQMENVPEGVPEEVVNRQKGLIKANLSAAVLAAGQFEELNKHYVNLHGKGKVHFRVFYSLGTYELDLVKTE